MSSTHPNSDSATVNDVVDSETTVVTDADYEELENVVSCYERAVSPHRQRVREVAQYLLQHFSGIISTTSLMESVEIDAANFLVDECLFLSTDDLFKDCDDFDCEGYIKYVPDVIDQLFICRLIRYNIDPTSYFKNIELSHVWKSRLSANGIRMLRAMKFYRDLLDSSPPESPSNVEVIDNANNEQNQYSSSILYDRPQNQQLESEIFTDIIKFQQPLPPKDSEELYHRVGVFLERHIQMEWIILNKPGCGLVNKDGEGICKNICYMNAIIQCLANTAPFVQWLLNDHLGDTCDLTVADRFCSVCLLRSIIRGIHHNINNEYTLSSISSYATAESFAQQINELSSTFTLGRQEDPSEFLLLLLAHLNRCMTITEPSININSSITVIQRIFGLNVQSITKCKVCLLESVKEDWESILSIAIFSHSTLINALAAEFIEKELDRDNLYKCTNCKKEVPSSQKCQITRASPIVLFHLKRFIYNNISHTTRKIHQLITYPEILNLKSYFIEKDQESNKENEPSDNFKYQLYGVVVHLGEHADEGHVFAYVRSPDGFWYRTNDESVTRVKLNQVLNDKDAYILCYAKIPTGSIASANTEWIIPLAQSPSLFTSSTPIRPSKPLNNITNNYATTKLSKNTDGFNNNCSKQYAIGNNLLSTEYSSILNDDDIMSDHSLSEEDLASVKIQSCTENISESNIFQTESRIEIIPNNENIQKHSKQKLNDAINEQPIDVDVDLNSSSETFTYSISQREETFSSIFRNTQLSSSRSQNISSKISSSVPLNITVEDIQVGDDFVAELPSSSQFKLQSVDHAKLLEIRNKKINKKKTRLFEQMGLSDVSDDTPVSKKIFISKQNKITKSSIIKNTGNEDLPINIENKEKKQSNVDVEYLYILLPYIKQFNKYCGLCVRITTFGTTSTPYRQLLRCKLHCIGHPVCQFACTVNVQNNGVGYIIVTNRTVRHPRGVKICRPIREPLRSQYKKQFAQGGSVFRIYNDKLQQRTLKEIRGKNYDGIGKSQAILRKIKSEGVLESLLAPEVEQGLSKLLEKFKIEINPDGKVKGAIQYVSKHPSKIIIYSESSIRLFNTLLERKNVVISWDATGSIIKETNSRRLLYYELSATLPGIVNENSIIPITFMISDAHDLVNVTHWLSLFKHSYSQVFVGKQFPRPRIVLSDRAQVFLRASLQVWNNETMKAFLNRSYRIVTGNGTEADENKTIIHACLSHVLLDSRKTINKYIPERHRNLAMWCMALLINTSLWNEFVESWQLICFVFLQLHLGGENMNEQYQDALMVKISKIHSDQNTKNVIESSEILQDDDSNNISTSDIYEYDDSDGELDEKTSKNPSKSKRKKIILDEEKEANSIESPFKSKFIEIFHDVLITCGLSVKEFQAATSRGILKWFKYLTNYFMPTSVVWSNLLLGDLLRHRRRIVRSYETMIIHKEQQRTTAISERRMGILKRTQLGGELHVRVDVLLSILIPDMLTMVDEFRNALLKYCSTSTDNSNADNTTVFDEQLFKPIEERWRQKVSKRGTGHYAKGPDHPVFTDLLSSLLASEDNINKNIKLPAISPNWLDIAIGMLLSLENQNILHHQSILSSTNSNPLLSVILTFLEEWHNSSKNNTKSTNINFSVPNNELNKPNERSIYILEKILIPLLPCHLIIKKVYKCESCQSTVKVRSTITSIPINISNSGLHLEQDLFYFFAPTVSDMLCSSCRKSTTRYIEVIQWPPVLIININNSIQSAKQRKPPSTLSLGQFSNWLAVGSPSTSIYNLICFNSVTQYGGNETMVRATKVGKSWLTNINKRVIGEGEQLQGFFAHSRIIIFERIHNQNKFNFVYAIFQCALKKSSIILDDLPESVTLHEACSVIEKHAALTELNDALVANIITYSYCHSCLEVPDSLRVQNTQIFIFKLTPKNEMIAYPIVQKAKGENSVEQYCTYCNYSSNDVEMNVRKQVFVECPSCLIRFADEKVHAKELFESSIKLTDQKNIIYSYKTSAILLLSKYSNIATIVKYEADNDKYLQLNDCIYTETKELSKSKLADLFDTSSYTLVFYHQIQSTAPSQMRIVSQTNFNGVQRIVIQNGDQFFAITPAASNTTST